VARHAPDVAQDPEAPFHLGHGLATPRLARLHYELLALVRSRATALAIDDALADLADEAVRAVYGGRRRRAAGGCRSAGGSRSAAAFARRRDLVEATKLAINAHLDAPPRLMELARVTGCSPFHLSRTFRRTTGESLRRYVGRLRALVAADRLAAGARDLTDLALDLGYADHSHFTNRFRREWGMPPARFRALAGGA
jgi:AraC-like DNA-binding protein